MKTILILTLCSFSVACQSTSSSNLSYIQREENPKQEKCVSTELFNKTVSYSYRPTICQEK